MLSFYHFLSITKLVSFLVFFLKNLQLLEMLSLYDRTSEPSDWRIDQNVFSNGQDEDDEVCDSFVSKRF